MFSQLFYRTGLLVCFIVRRDRFRLALWVFSIALVTVLTANAFASLYQTESERQIVAETMRNPAMIAMVGPGYGLDQYTIGAMLAHQMLLFTAIAVAIMSILLVTRYTRTDEEEGRIELIRSLPVGRLASLSAAVIVLMCTTIILAFLVGVSLFAIGIETIDLHGSLLYGAALGAVGFFFTAITALFAQASENTRGVIGYSFAILIIAYLLRAIGDVSNQILSWLSPLGWIVHTQVYVNNNWWPIILTIGIACILIVLAFYINAIRDVGAGLFPSKSGKRHASDFLKIPIGLFIRLQQISIIAWAIGMFVLGASYGSVLGDLEAFFESNEMLKEMLVPIEGFSLTEQYLTMLMSIISMMCTIPALLFMLKLKGEEKKHFVEYLLTHAISRSKVLGSYVMISLVFGSLMLIFSVIGLWSASLGFEDSLSLSVILQSALVYLPAIWVMTGLAVLLIGYFPKWTFVTWLYLSYSFVVVYFGGLFQFPEWLAKLSPFGNVPKTPIEELNLIQLITLIVIAISLIILGFNGYKNRDIGGHM